MKLFDARIRRWLFVMTHPDDEISICAWIRQLCANGNEVFMAWTHSTPARELESRMVAKLLGVRDENLTFFTATDGKIACEFAELRPRFAELMGTVQPDVVVCGAFEQGHLDHDTTNVLVRTTFSGPVFEVPFYHTYVTAIQTFNAFSDPTGQEILPLNSEFAKLKRQVSRSYPSQNIASLLVWFEIYQVMQLRRPVLAQRELMRLHTVQDFSRPNHPEPLARRVAKHEKWHWWCDHVLPHLRG